MKNIILLSLFVFIFSSAVFSQNGIRDVDFRNFTYQPYCAGPGEETRNITIKNGQFYEETKTEDGFTNRFYFNAFEIIYGDVDGNNSDEAIVLTLCNTGGTGNFTEGFIYGMKDGQPALLARIEGGDRAYGGLRDVSVENGKIIKVERSAPGESGATCCPEKIETTIYRFENNALVQIGEKTQKEIYPAERIEFDEGKNTKLFKVRINTEDQIKRFVVRAKKGQTLEVITSSPEVKVRLHKGKAKVLNVDEKLFQGPYATNEFAAKLKESGDFVFELSNFSNIDLDFFVTVKIK
jgi:hypothetical protein